MNLGVTHSENRICIDVVDKDLDEKRNLFFSRFAPDAFVKDEASGKDVFCINPDWADGSLTIRFHQLDVKYGAFRTLLGKLTDAAKALTSVDLRDYNDVPKEQRTSSYFNTFNAYKLNGRVYSVGGGFGMQEKLNQIARLLTLCGEPLSAVVIEGYELKASGKQGKKVNTADEFDDFLND